MGYKSTCGVRFSPWSPSWDTRDSAWARFSQRDRRWWRRAERTTHRGVSGKSGRDMRIFKGQRGSDERNATIRGMPTIRLYPPHRRYLYSLLLSTLGSFLSYPAQSPAKNQPWNIFASDSLRTIKQNFFPSFLNLQSHTVPSLRNSTKTPRSFWTKRIKGMTKNFQISIFKCPSKFWLTSVRLLRMYGTYILDRFDLLEFQYFMI